MDFQKVVRLHTALRKRRWTAAEIARLREREPQDQTGEEGKNFGLSQQILDENSDDEDETMSGWHLVDELMFPHV